MRRKIFAIGIAILMIGIVLSSQSAIAPDGKITDRLFEKMPILKNLINKLKDQLLISNIKKTTLSLGPTFLLGNFKAVKLFDNFTYADGVKGITSALWRSGDGPFGHDLYVAYSSMDQIWKVARDGSGATWFADVGDFPVGVAFSPFDSFGNYLYVGNAFASSYAIQRIDSEGNVEDWVDLPATSGLAFPQGATAYGKYLYAATYYSSGKIYRIDSTGAYEEFKDSIPGQSRYIKFSHGNKFGFYLFVSNIDDGKIYKVYPDATYSVFADTGVSWGIEGMEFSPGGAFGHYLYVGVAFGNYSGTIFRIDDEGNVETFATGLGSVADIHFQPGGKGGFTMYIVTDGTGEVYAISKA